MMNRSFFFALALSVVLLGATPAAADVSDADRATARTLAVEGQEALNRNDFPVALDRFRRADSLIHAPTLLIGVARAQVGLGQFVAAQESYSRILREGVAPNSPQPFFVALDDARRELDALVPLIAHVTIAIQGPKMSDAVVTIDDLPVPTASLGVKRPVDPGTHRIHATANGFLPADATITLAKSAHQVVTLKLKPSPVSTTGLNAPKDQPIEEPFNRTPLAIASFGLGGAGLLLGTVTGILAIGKHGDLKQACPQDRCPTTQQDTLNAYHTLGTLSTVGFVVGGAGVGAGILLLLTQPSKPPRAALSPRLGIGFVGAEGRF